MQVIRSSSTSLDSSDDDILVRCANWEECRGTKKGASFRLLLCRAKKIPVEVYTTPFAPTVNTCLDNLRRVWLFSWCIATGEANSGSSRGFSPGDKPFRPAFGRYPAQICAPTTELVTLVYNILERYLASTENGGLVVFASRFSSWGPLPPILIPGFHL